MNQSQVPLLELQWTGGRLPLDAVKPAGTSLRHNWLDTNNVTSSNKFTTILLVTMATWGQQQVFTCTYTWKTCAILISSIMTALWGHTVVRSGLQAQSHISLVHSFIHSYIDRNTTNREPSVIDWKVWISYVTTKHTSSECEATPSICMTFPDR